MAKTLKTMSLEELEVRVDLLRESVAALEETVEEAKQEGWRLESQEDALVMLGEARRQLARALNAREAAFFAIGKSDAADRIAAVFRGA
jgi:hypothetical protein